MHLLPLSSSCRTCVMVTRTHNALIAAMKPYRMAISHLPIEKRQTKKKCEVLSCERCRGNTSARSPHISKQRQYDTSWIDDEAAAAAAALEKDRKHIRIVFLRFAVWLFNILNGEKKIRDKKKICLAFKKQMYERERNGLDRGERSPANLTGY